MAGQRTLLLAGFLLPGFLLSEAAKILTVSTLGKCLGGEPGTAASQAPGPGLRHMHQVVFQTGSRPRLEEGEVGTLLWQRGVPLLGWGSPFWREQQFPFLSSYLLWK